MTHRIVIRPALDMDGRQRMSYRGPLYEASFEGRLILEASHQPFLDGCRELMRRGIFGPAEMWDEIRPYPRMVGTVEGAAKLTLRDPDNGRVGFAKWKPWWGEGL